MRRGRHQAGQEDRRHFQKGRRQALDDYHAPRDRQNVGRQRPGRPGPRHLRRDHPTQAPRRHCALTEYQRRPQMCAGRQNEPMDDLNSEWQRKGATLSDKTTREEYGLTQDEIIQAITAGKLQYREASVYGSPFLRLLRREVEALVENKHGSDYLADRQTKTELARINRELNTLKKQIAALEEQKSKLLLSRSL